MNETKLLKRSNVCAYPRCKKKIQVQLLMSVGEMVEGGQIIVPENPKESHTPLCEYHVLLANKGIIQLVNQQGMIILVAPTEVISLIEKMSEIKEEFNERKKKTEKVSGMRISQSDDE